MIVELTLDQALYVARNMQQVDFDEVMATRWDDDRDTFALDSYYLKGPKWAAIGPSGKPVCMGGVAFNTPGTGTAWMVTTDEFPKMALSVTRHAKKHFQMLVQAEGVYRIQALSAVFHKQSHGWLKACGMRKESLVKRLGSKGEDFYMYAMTRGQD